VKTAVIALTQQGTKLAGKIGGPLEADVFIKEDFVDQVGEPLLESRVFFFDTTFHLVMEKAFRAYDALICVMACGIVVRSLAPHLMAKQSDPAVVVVDEKGQFAISLLSGHIGGANSLAGQVAALTGGTPVITTATDVQGLAAFDELAVKNKYAIENIHMLKWVSGALVNGKSVGLYADVSLQGTLPDQVMLWQEGQLYGAAVALTNSLKIPDLGKKTLILRPRNLVLGIGCKKGKKGAEIAGAVKDFLARNGKSPSSLRCLASIDLKAEEPGIVDFSNEAGIPFRTFPPEKIKEIEDQLTTSDFVRRTTGVGSVAEACAMLAGSPGTLIAGKTVYPGITLALWEEKAAFHFQP